MATAKKGKKSSKAKSGSKGKKKNNNMSSFSKFMLILLFIAVLAGAVLYTLKNFNIKNNNNDVKQEVVSKTNNTKENIVKTEPKPSTNKESKNEAKPKTEKATEPKAGNTNTKKASVEEKTAELKQEVKVSKTMTGSWHSSEQGAFLTMDEYGYRIDFSNVHASKPITGDYRIENNLIVFSSDGSECGNEDGTYRVNFFKKNISLTCKDDDCTNRRNILEADWEWLEY